MKQQTETPTTCITVAHRRFGGCYAARLYHAKPRDLDGALTWRPGEVVGKSSRSQHRAGLVALQYASTHPRVPYIPGVRFGSREGLDYEAHTVPVLAQNPDWACVGCGELAPVEAPGVPPDGWSVVKPPHPFAGGWHCGCGAPPMIWTRS